MNMNDLIEGLAINWLSDLIRLGILTIFSLGLAYLNSKNPDWGSHARYFLTIFVLLAVTWFTFTGRAIVSVQQPQTNEDNVEGNVKLWADKVGFGMKDTSESVKNNGYFLLEITLANGHPVQVGRLKDKERQHYLGFIVPLELRPKQQAAFDEFTEVRKEQFESQLMLELGRIKIGYSIDLNSSPKHITLTKSVPISNSLTQNVFLSTVDEMDSAITVVDAITNLDLSSN